VTVPLYVIDVVDEDDAGRVVWLEEHAAVTIVRAIVAVR